MNCIKNELYKKWTYKKIMYKKWTYKKWNYKKWTYKKRTYKEWTYKKKNWSIGPTFRHQHQALCRLYSTWGLQSGINTRSLTGHTVQWVHGAYNQASTPGPLQVIQYMKPTIRHQHQAFDRSYSTKFHFKEPVHSCWSGVS